MFSLKRTWPVWTMLAALAVGSVGQVALAQVGQAAGNPPVFNPEYVEVAAKRLLPEIKVIAPGSSEFSALVDKFSQEARDAQIARILPLDRRVLNYNPLTLVPFTLLKPLTKLYIPEKPILTSSALEALLRGNGAAIAPMGVVQIGDKFFPTTLQGEPYAPGGRIYVALHDDSNKVVSIISAPQEVTISTCMEVLLQHGPEDRFAAQFQMMFTDVVLLNIAASLQN